LRGWGLAVGSVIIGPLIVILRTNGADYGFRTCWKLIAASRRQRTGIPDQWAAFEAALSHIQLPGIKDQIETTSRYVENHARLGGAIIDPVLEIARDDPRREMGLSEDIPRILCFVLKAMTTPARLNNA
jgi:hypothetical protein